jgi:hypothetical protein
MDEQRNEDNLRLRFQEKFDMRYVDQEEYENFKSFRFGRVEKLVLGCCAIILGGVVTAVLAFIINKPL